MSEARKLIGRVVNAIRTAVIERVDDAKQVQELQVTVLEDEVDDAVPHYQPLGVSFRPAAGGEVLTVSVGSDAMNRIALAVQARGKRPTDAAEGCGGVYRPLAGTWALYVADDGTLHLGAKDPADWVALASLVLDELNAVKADFDALKAAYDAHTHSYSPGPSAPAPTAPPLTPAPTPHTPASVASDIVKSA